MVTRPAARSAAQKYRSWSGRGVESGSLHAGESRADVQLEEYLVAERDPIKQHAFRITAGWAVGVLDDPIHPKAAALGEAKRGEGGSGG